MLIQKEIEAANRELEQERHKFKMLQSHKIMEVVVIQQSLNKVMGDVSKLSDLRVEE